MTHSGPVLYSKNPDLDQNENQTTFCFAQYKTEWTMSIPNTPVYKHVDYNTLELVRSDTPVMVSTTCVEIDECLETYHACGDD